MTEWRPSIEDLEAVIEWWQAAKAEWIVAAETARDQKNQALFQAWKAVKQAAQDGQVPPALEAARDARWTELQAAEDSLKALPAFDAWADDWQAVTRTMLTLEKALRRTAEPAERARLRDQWEAVEAQRRDLVRQFQVMVTTNPIASAALDHLREEREMNEE